MAVAFQASWGGGGGQDWRHGGEQNKAGGQGPQRLQLRLGHEQWNKDPGFSEGILPDLGRLPGRSPSFWKQWGSYFVSVSQPTCFELPNNQDRICTWGPVGTLSSGLWAVPCPQSHHYQGCSLCRRGWSHVGWGPWRDQCQVGCCG